MRPIAKGHSLAFPIGWLGKGCFVTWVDSAFHASGQEPHSLCSFSDYMIPQANRDFFLLDQPFLSKDPVMISGHSFLYSPKAINSSEVTLHSGPGRKGLRSLLNVLCLLLRLGLAPVSHFSRTETPKHSVNAQKQIWKSHMCLNWLWELNATCISSL